MIKGLLSGLGRHRGVLTAVAFVVALAFWSLFRKGQTPLIRWVEATPARTSGQEFLSDGETITEFAPDGRAVLFFDEQHAHLRDVKTGRIARLHLDTVRSGNRFEPRFSETGWMDQGRLLVGLVQGSDRLGDIHPSLHVWEVPSGREVLSVAEVGDGLDHQRFVVSDDGSTLAYLQGPPGPLTVGVWSRAAGEAQTRYFPGSGEIALSSDGHFLTVYETRGVVADLVVWDVRTSERLATISPATFDADAVAVSTDGHWVAEAQAGEFTLIALPSGRKMTIEHGYPVHMPWFSPDCRLLLSQSPRHLNSDWLEIWNLAVDPPALLFEGQIGGASRDGQRLVQVDDHMNEFLKTIRLTSPTDPGKVRAQPQIESGVVFQKGRGTGQRSLDGPTLAYLDNRSEASWYWTITKNLPAGLSPWPPGWRLSQSIEVIHADNGRVLRSIGVPERLERLDFRVIDNGTKVAVQTKVSLDRPERAVPLGTETTIEIWDVSGSGSTIREFAGPLLASFLALGLGGWYDRRRRRSRVSPEILAA